MHTAWTVCFKLTHATQRRISLNFQKLGIQKPHPFLKAFCRRQKRSPTCTQYHFGLWDPSKPAKNIATFRRV